jgi:hypothetical protein
VWQAQDVVVHGFHQVINTLGGVNSELAYPLNVGQMDVFGLHSFIVYSCTQKSISSLHIRRAALTGRQLREMALCFKGVFTGLKHAPAVSFLQSAL